MLENNEAIDAESIIAKKLDFAEILVDSCEIDFDDVESNEKLLLLSAYPNVDSNVYIFSRCKMCDNIANAFIKSEVFFAGRKGANAKVLQNVALDDVGTIFVFNGNELLPDCKCGAIKKAQNLVNIVAMYKDGNADGQELTYEYDRALSGVLHNAYSVVGKKIIEYVQNGASKNFSCEELLQDIDELRITEFLQKYSYKLDKYQEKDKELP